MKTRPSVIRDLSRTLNATPQGEWNHIAQAIIGDIALRNKLLGHLFPRSTTYLRKGVRPQQMSLEMEMVWAATLCGLHCAELRRFVAARSEIDGAILDSDFNDALQKHAAIEADIGISYWSVETKIGILSLAGNAQAQTAYFQKLSADQRTVPFLVNLLTSISWIRGAIDTSESSYLEIIRNIEIQIETRWRRQDALYFRFKAASLSLPEDSYGDFSAVLNGEANSPLVDRYLTVLRVCGFLIALNKEAHYPLILRVLDLMDGIDNAEHGQLRSFLTSTEQYSGPVPTTFDNYVSGNHTGAASLLSEKIKDERGLNASHLIHSAVLAAASAERAPGEHSVRNEICARFQDLLSRSENYNLSIEYLTLQSRRFSSSSWGAMLASRVRAEHHVETPWHPAPYSSRLHSVFLPEGDHVRIRYCPTGIFEALVARRDTLAPLYKIEVLMRMKALPDDRLLGSAIENQSYLIYRRAWWDYSDGRFAAAREGFRALCDDPNKSIRVKSRIFFLRLSVADYGEFVMAVVDYVLENPSIFQAIDCEEFLNGYKDSDEYDALRARPELSVFLYMYDAVYGLSRKREIADIVDILLSVWRVLSPVDLDRGLFSSDQLRIFFLSKVCVSEIREGAMYLETLERTYLERLSVCEELARFDPTRAHEYRAEHLALVESLSVRKFLAKFNGAKVYVNEKNLQRLFDDDGRRYLALLQLQSTLAPMNLEIFDGSKKLPELLLGGNIDFYLLHQPYAAIGELFYREKRFGLNTSLSMCIGHGIIDGKIMSSMSGNGLTKRSVNDTLKKLEDGEAVTEALTHCITRFAHQVEQQIKELKATILESRSEGNPQALLDYTCEVASPVVLKHIHVLAQTLNERTTFDEFCAILINLHWERTVENLKAVRAHLRQVFKKRIQSSYDDFLSDVKRNCPSALTIVKNQVVAAKMDWARDLEEIVSWFEKGKAGEYEEFSLALVIQAALENTKELYPDVRFKLALANDSTRRFESVCFHALLTIINIMFENIVKNSNSRWPVVTLTARDQGTSLFIRVENEIPDWTDSERADHRTTIQVLLASLESDAFYHRVDLNKNSGIAKIKKLITSDLSREARITADICDRLFYIELDIMGWEAQR